MSSTMSETFLSQFTCKAAAHTGSGRSAREMALVQADEQRGMTSAFQPNSQMDVGNTMLTDSTDCKQVLDEH